MFLKKTFSFHCSALTALPEEWEKDREREGRSEKERERGGDVFQEYWIMPQEELVWRWAPVLVVLGEQGCIVLLWSDM